MPNHARGEGRAALAERAQVARATSGCGCEGPHWGAARAAGAAVDARAVQRRMGRAVTREGAGDSH